MIPERRSNDTRIALLEQSIGGMANDVLLVKNSQHEMNQKLDGIVITLAEARGAARVGKWVVGTATALLGAVGGALGGNITASQKVAAVAEQIAPHVK